MPQEITVTTLGWVYNALTIAWSVILVAGMLFLYRHRKLPFLRIRRLPLVFSAIVLLHLYGVASMIAYTIGSLIPCDVQFWVMSIYLPFGMALLQAANSQFLHVASQQRRYARATSLDGSELPETNQIDSSQSWPRRTIDRVRNLDRTTKVVFYIGLAMAVELALTFFIYFGSEIFHPSYGIFHAQVPGTEEGTVLCLTGWEWWLSIVWQFFWAWIYAPYLLWRTRNIHDTHGWRIQTICCCIAGLPASPLWLAALYIPEMAPANAVVVPPQWFSFSIFFIELFTIFIPCWQVIKSHNLHQETLDAIAAWEEKNSNLFTDPDCVSTAGYSGSTFRASTLSTSVAEQSRKSISVSKSSYVGSCESRKSDILTMVALENALRANPQPLLEFAALKDFSGENVSFLTHVADWKRAAAARPPPAEGEQFVRAVQIYSHFVSLDLSEFPVNLSSRAAKQLSGIFDGAAKALLHGRRRSEQSDLSSATPFDEVSPGSSTASLNGGQGCGPTGLERTLGKANLQSVVRMAELSGSGSEGTMPGLPVPAEFGPQVFDIAEAEIKHLVLTNTWPKFVRNSAENNERSQKETTHVSHMRKMLCGLGDIV